MEKTDRIMARGLLEIGAVLLSPDHPFTWASGWRSPIYCDNRRILSDPVFRSRVAQALAEAAERLAPQAGYVAGVATGAIAHGALAADRMGKPFVYVRPKPKDHGTGSQIEGRLPEGARVVVIEDLVSTGMSSLAAVEALRGAGARVEGMVAIFTYGFEMARERFSRAEVPLVTLTSYPALVAEAEAKGLIGPGMAEVLGAWREDPAGWGAGFAGETGK